MKAPPSLPVTLQDLRDLLARLRGPEGCPWDRKQTPETLKSYLLEEAYELADALDRHAEGEIHEELGDVLFILLFITRVYEERGAFELEQVMSTIHQKMVRRHPHVFGEADWDRAEDVVRGWQAVKSLEKPHQNPLDSIPAALPGLLKAHRLSQRAAGLGFEWPSVSAVLQKLREEMTELEAALAAGSPAAVEEELGDVLFTLVSLGRVSGRPAENALAKTNLKFAERFGSLLEDPSLEGRDPRSLTSDEWRFLWERHKKPRP